MLTPEEVFKIRQMEESITVVSDFFPKLWKALFDSCIREGFTECQAMDLVKTYMSRPSE